MPISPDVAPFATGGGLATLAAAVFSLAKVLKAIGADPAAAVIAWASAQTEHSRVHTAELREMNERQERLERIMYRLVPGPIGQLRATPPAATVPPAAAAS